MWLYITALYRENKHGDQHFLFYFPDVLDVIINCPKFKNDLN